MRGGGRAAACGFAVFIALAAAARAEFRHALVIGNAAYPGASLASPKRDAQAVGEALRARGFTVTEAVNLTAEKLRETVADFAVAVPTRGTALVYFAGKCVPMPPVPQPTAIQDSLLLAVDHGDLAKQPQFRSYGLTARQVLAQLATEYREPPTPGVRTLRRQGGSLTNILILDGCYPGAGLPAGSPGGLVKSGTLVPESMIIYAAPFGETVEPTTDGLSPLATRLVAGLASPQPLDEVLAAVGGARESTAGDLSFLAEPASTSVSPPDRLEAGAKAGDEWVNRLGMVFCWCPPGSFTIGTGPPRSRQSPWDEQPDEGLADVTFPRGFWIGKYECTLRDMRALMAATHRSTGTHKLYPLNRIGHSLFDNWRHDVEGMIAKLNETAPPGWVYDMPTEAEWEYAARAGSPAAYSFGDDPADLARHGNFADRTLRESASKGEAGDWAPVQKPPHYTGLFSYAHDTWTDGHTTLALVGSYLPNAWGLHDVHGNVAELTSTPYHAARMPLANPPGGNAPVAVMKGGSWVSVPSYCRLAFRGRVSCEEEQYEGLRVVLRRKDSAPPRKEPRWTPLVPTRVTTAGATEATIAADGTVAVTGRLVKDTYVVEAVVPAGITPRAIRLEALADPSLPQQGPGRAGTGTFVLGEFSVSFGPPGAKEATTPLAFLHATADFAATNGRAEMAIDGRPELGWNTFGSAGRNHAAVFFVRLPTQNGDDGAVWRHPASSAADARIPLPGAPLTFTLDHPNAATIGKFRLSITEDDVLP